MSAASSYTAVTAPGGSADAGGAAGSTARTHASSCTGPRLPTPLHTTPPAARKGNKCWVLSQKRMHWACQSLLRDEMGGGFAEICSFLGWLLLIDIRICAPTCMCGWQQAPLACLFVCCLRADLMPTAPPRMRPAPPPAATQTARSSRAAPTPAAPAARHWPQRLLTQHFLPSQCRHCRRPLRPPAPGSLATTQGRPDHAPRSPRPAPAAARWARGSGAPSQSRAPR